MSVEFLRTRPNLEVRDVGTALRFYRDELGFQVVSAMGDPVWFALVERDGAGLALVASESPAVPAIATCYVDVVGVDDLYEHCRSQGATITSELSTHPWGMRDFVVQDGDGHQIAFGERMTPAH